MRPTIDLAETARRHLSPDVAAAWIKFLRPAIQLSSDSGRGAVVGCLGGRPSLPEDLAWPEWPGKGPLSLVATLDCAALPVIDGLPMPDTGTLLFFYFDGQYDDAAALVYCGDPASKAGAQVLYIPEDTPTTLRRTPEGIKSYPTVQLCASIIETTASYDHLVIQEAPLHCLIGRRVTPGSGSAVRSPGRVH